MLRTIARMTTIKLILVVLLSTALAGCSGSPGLGKPGGEAPVVIAVWHSLQGGQEQQLQQELKRISQKRPEILIQTEYIPEAAFADQAWKYQAGGEGPEIFISSRSTLFALYEKGALAPVLAAPAVFPAAQAVYTFNQQAYAVPWLIDAPMLYYRSDTVAAPASLNALWDRKAPLAISSFNLSLLNAWWRAEGGYLMQDGKPALNAPVNSAFIAKLQFLRADGLLVVDPAALDRFSSGEINYLLAPASAGRILDQRQIDWKCASLYSVLGAGGKTLFDNQIGIANSSIKTTPVTEQAVKIVEEELLSPETMTAMVQAGGRLPAAVPYYEGAAAPSLNYEANIALQNGWMFEGGLKEWKVFTLFYGAFPGIAGGSTLEQDLVNIQTTAEGLFSDK